MTLALITSVCLATKDGYSLANLYRKLKDIDCFVLLLILDTRHVYATLSELHVGKEERYRYRYCKNKLSSPSLRTSSKGTNSVFTLWHSEIF